MRSEVKELTPKTTARANEDVTPKYKFALFLLQVVRDKKSINCRSIKLA